MKASKIIFLMFLSITSLQVYSETKDDGKLRLVLEKEVDRLEPEVIKLRSLSELKKNRDGLKVEKEELVNNISGESSSKILRDLEILKSEISRLKPLSELSTRKRALNQEKKTLMENIYKNDK